MVSSLTFSRMNVLGFQMGRKARREVLGVSRKPGGGLFGPQGLFASLRPPHVRARAAPTAAVAALPPSPPTAPSSP